MIAPTPHPGDARALATELARLGINPTRLMLWTRDERQAAVLRARLGEVQVVPFPLNDETLWLVLRPPRL